MYIHKDKVILQIKDDITGLKHTNIIRHLFKNDNEELNLLV